MATNEKTELDHLGDAVAKEVGRLDELTKSLRETEKTERVNEEEVVGVLRAIGRCFRF